MEEDFIKDLELTEEDVEKTKQIYEDIKSKNPKISELSLGDFSYILLEFGALHFRIKTDLERLIEIKQYFDMNPSKEEFMLKYLNFSLEDAEETEEE